MIKPIAKKLLPHQVVYNSYSSDGGEGPTFGTSTTLYNVKVEEVKQLSRTKDGKEIMGNALMFYDYVNSTGLTTEPTEQGKITFNGKTYYITMTETHYENNVPHHYEITLK